MKKILLYIIVPLTLVSCKKENQTLSNLVIKKKVDSILSVRIPELDRDANRDLEHRMVIELRVKSDSILKTRLAADTLHKSNKPK